MTVPNKDCGDPENDLDVTNARLILRRLLDGLDYSLLRLEHGEESSEVKRFVHIHPDAEDDRKFLLGVLRSALRSRNRQ